MSDYLQKIVYLTDSQYETLAGGGTVGSLTGLNDNYIYITDGKVSLSDFDDSFILPVNKGGTGASSWASGKILVGNGSSTFSTIDKATTATGGTLVERNANGDFSARNITMTQGNIGSMTLSGTTIAALTTINTSGGNGLLAYKPSSWTGVTSSQWGVGTIDIQGVIRSSNTDLLHSRHGTNSVILDAGNYKTYAYALDGSNTGTKLQISTQSAAYTNGIQFMYSTTKKGSIGTDNTGIIGIYGTKVVLRPQLDASTKGVEVTTTAMYPTDSITLGTTSNKWSTVYATTFDGALQGNADTATTATNLSAKPTLAASGNNITVTAGGKTSDAFTVPYATSADSATSLTNFVVSTYTIAASKGVRITYPSHAPVLISCQRSTGGSRLILIGGGYGAEGTARNDFTELVSPSESHFTWSMPQTTGYACTIEIMHHDTSGTATVWVESTAACTFTEITALTTTATNRTLLHSSNYTDYTVTKTGTGASGSWGISITGSSASCTGNAATATAIQTAGTTAQFYRGDNSWSNIIKQTASAVLGIDTNLKIGTARKDLNFDIANGSGTGINDGCAGGITWGLGDEAYAGIYYQTSGRYGTRLIFGTTGSYANGAYARMIIQGNGNIGIGTLSPDTLLTVNGNAKATKFIGALEGNANTASKLTAITTTDAASSSDTWRRLWISYSNNTEGRPAYTDSLVYQTSTNTLKTPHLLIEHASGGSAEMHITYSDTIDYWWGVGTANENHGLYDVKASKWILSAGAANTWTFVGNVTGNVTGSSGSCTGNAVTATTATNLSAAPTITQAGSSGTTLSAATFYTLTVGGQTVVFKTPTDTKNSAYGNINTSGQIAQTTNWALANGDALVVADSNNSWKLERTGITFDASTETECLTKKGTWKAFNNYSLPTAKNNTLGGVKPWYSHTAASTGPTTGSNATAITVNAIQTTAGRYYAVESDSNGRLFVNVPWTNVNSSYLTSHNNLVTQNVKTDNKKYGIILSNYETSASTTTAAAVNRDSKVYVNPSLNSVNAGQFVLHDKAATPVEKAYMIWNATDQSIDFVFN